MGNRETLAVRFFTGPWDHSVSRMFERDQTMRRLCFSLLALCLVGVSVGCQATHGVCDCGCDFDDHCAYRAPWVNEGPPANDGPAPLPEMGEPLPNAPKIA